MLAGITIFEHVFEEKLCQFLYKNAVEELSRGKSFTRSNFHWNPVIVRSSQVVLVRDYDEILSKVILGALQERGVIESDDFHVMNYAWTPLSYIPWHNDAGHQYAITIYLNEKWDRDWGGLFLYRDASEGDIRGFAPQFNSAVKNGANIEHATTMITPDSPDPRMTIQIFPNE